MANIDMCSGYGQGMTVTDRRWTPADVADQITSAEFVATQDIRTIDTWLAAQNAAYWTQTRLNQESTWDKLFYLRSQASAPGGLA